MHPNIISGNYVQDYYMRPRNLKLRQQLGKEMQKHEKDLYKYYNRKAQYFSDYCNYTTIHGFKYLGEMGRSPWEKIWWIIIILLGMSLCGGLIYINYKKWEKSPIIITPLKVHTPIWESPFPAVTICTTPCIRKNVFNYTGFLERQKNNDTTLTEEEINKLILVKAFCERELAASSATDLDFFEEISYSIDDLITDCEYGDRTYNCNTLFKPVFIGTSDKCFTFNMFDREDLYEEPRFFYKNYMKHGRRNGGWTLDKGYPPNSGTDVYPLRAITKDLNFNLKLPLADMDPSCLTYKGFGLHFHTPIEFPVVQRIKPITIPTRKAMRFFITPEVTITSDDLRSYSPKERDCYFENEKKLKYFKVYSITNCDVECLYNITKMACGCSDYGIFLFNNTTTCEIKHLQCRKIMRTLFWAYKGNAEYIIIDEIYKELFSHLIFKVPYLYETSASDVIKCNCLPTCTSLKYNFDKRDLDKPPESKKNDVFSNEETNIIEESTSITITYREFLYVTYQRKKLFGLIDFAANCGGLLGLFSGISFVSIFEIIYFLTLRWWCSGSKKNKIWVIHP